MISCVIEIIVRVILFLLQHIINYMKDILKWHVELDEFEDVAPEPFGKMTFTNIIATKDIDAPRRLVLACHYDSKYFSNIEFIGMADSAVPCAMLMDIARVVNEPMERRRDSKVYNLVCCHLAHTTNILIHFVL